MKTLPKIINDLILSRYFEAFMLKPNKDNLHHYREIIAEKQEEGFNMKEHIIYYGLCEKKYRN